MKEGWEYKKLKDVATFTRGLTYSKNDEAENSNNIVLRSNNVDLSTGKLNFEELKYLKPEFSIPEEKKVKKGSLLMCMSNGSKIHLGKVALIDKDYPYAFGGFMALVTPNEKLNPRFFHYSLSSPEYKDFIKKLSAGANINNIKVKELDLFTIPVPPLSEQQSIVDYLDSAFAKIDAMKANAEKSLNEAKALFQASLKEMLEPKEGWEYKKLDDICYSVEDGDWIESKDQSLNGIRLIQTGNIGNGCYKDKQDSAKYISEETFKRLHCTEIFKGDILVSRLPDPVGRACILPDLGCRCITAVDCSILRIRKNLACNAWITYFMQSQAYFSIIKAQCTGSTRLRITRKKLAEILVPVPSLSEQQSIVTTLDSLKSKVDRLQENYDKISQECDALKQALLRQVFE